MSATGLATAAHKNRLAHSFTDAAPYLTVVKGLTLQAPTAAGASTFSVDLLVAAGDQVVFDCGQGSQEACTVLSVAGSGPYTVTPVAPLVNAHVLTGSNSGVQSHIPGSDATFHEVASITRTAASWGDPSPAGIVTSAPAAITLPNSAAVGAVAAMSAATTHAGTGLSSATTVITETATPAANDDLVIFTAVGATPLLPNYPYYVVAKSTNAFSVAKTKGGTAITLGTATGLAYIDGFCLDFLAIPGFITPPSGTPNLIPQMIEDYS